jgi:hypothetical protein
MRVQSGVTITVAVLALSIGAAVPARGQVEAPRSLQDERESRTRRYNIRVMEGVLEGAVRHGAELLSAELRPINPNLVLLTGTARARGILLDGYGIFFSVEIPALRESVMWSIRTMTLEPNPFLARSLTQLRSQIAALQDPSARASLEQSITQIERQMQIEPAPRRGDGGPRRVSSAAIDAASESGAPDPSAAASKPPARDPGRLYTEAVKDALVEAMLDYSAPMALQPDEWLTVAARDADGPLMPGEPYDAVTLVLRIRGAHLAEFRAGRLTREDVRARVEVREF